MNGETLGFTIGFAVVAALAPTIGMAIVYKPPKKWSTGWRRLAVVVLAGVSASALAGICAYWGLLPWLIDHFPNAPTLQMTNVLLTISLVAGFIGGSAMAYLIEGEVSTVGDGGGIKFAPAYGRSRSHGVVSRVVGPR
jgi:hypothetical protein